jgi:cysteine desulfurase
VGARPEEVLFTGGATEANNLLVAGAEGRLVTSAAEHPSVHAPGEAREQAGLQVTRVPVDGDGRLDLEALEAALAQPTGLVSLVWANNETGVIQPIERIARLVGGRAPLHVDATQALGKIPVEGPWDFLSASAHKLNGPKGVGCLVARRPLRPLLRGGGQERGLRGGTENVAGIVGFGMACELARKELPERAAACAALRDRLWRALSARPGVRRNGDPREVLPNTLSVEIPGVEGDAVVQALDLEGVAVSAGAACHAGAVSASRVLLAMGRTPEQARATLRFSVGLGNDARQIDEAVARLDAVLERLA